MPSILAKYDRFKEDTNKVSWSNLCDYSTTLACPQWQPAWKSLQRLRVIAPMSESDMSLGSEEDNSHRARYITTNRKLPRRLLENRGNACEDESDGHIALDMVEAKLVRGAFTTPYYSTTKCLSSRVPPRQERCEKLDVMPLLLELQGTSSRKTRRLSRPMGRTAKPVSHEILHGLWKEIGVVGTLETILGHKMGLRTAEIDPAAERWRTIGVICSAWR